MVVHVCEVQLHNRLEVMQSQDFAGEEGDEDSKGDGGGDGDVMATRQKRQDQFMYMTRKAMEGL